MKLDELERLNRERTQGEWLSYSDEGPIHYPAPNGEQIQNKRLVGIIREIVNGNERVLAAARKVFANAKTGICPEIDADGNFAREKP